MDNGKKKKGNYIGFQALENKIAQDPNVDNPAAVAASIGRKKYGKGRMQRAAALGKPITQVK